MEEVIPQQTTLAARPPNANPSPYANRSPHANTATTKPLNAPVVAERSPIIHSHLYAYQPIGYPLTNLPATAHSNTIPSRRSPGSSRPHTPAPLQLVASTTDETSVDSMAIRVNPHPDTLLLEQQQAEGTLVRAPRGRTKKAPVQRRVEFPQGLSPISTGRHGAAGAEASGTSINKQSILKVMRNSVNDESLQALKRMIECTSNFVRNEQE